MKKKYSVLWAGTDEAFELLMAGEQRATTLEAVSCDSVAEEGGILHVQNGVGVIQVKGVLTNKDAWYNELIGLVSYGEIQEALYQAVTDPDVKEILMDIGSPGGTVYGLTEAVDAVAKAASIKPLNVFSDSVMASAAMWLSAPAENRFVSPLASVGSIGVVVKHVEVSKMMEEMGVTETIVRAGKFKQLANSSEPLTPEAEATLQESVDHAYGVFVTSVAEHLGKSYREVDSRMAQGREFMGSQAVDVGLVDAVSTFDEVFAGMQIRILRSSGGGDMKKKYAMSEAMQIAAAASGGLNLSKEDEETKVPVDGEGDELEAKAEGEGAQAASEGDGGELKAAATDEAGEASGSEAEGDEATLAVKVDVDSSAVTAAVSVLKDQLKEKDDELFALKTELNETKAKAEVVDELAKIAASSINNMVVALGGTAMEMEAVSPKEIVEQHAATATRFASEFKIGGVAATEADEAEPVVKASISRLDERRVTMAVKPKKA